MTMQIHLKFFASVREALGTSGETIAVPADVATVGALRALLVARGGVWAEALGEGLKVPVVSLSPEDAPAHFGWLAIFAGLDMAASSEWTRKALGWTPTGPGLIADLRAMDYCV